jgi:hypothetical protein
MDIALAVGLAAQLRQLGPDLEGSDSNVSRSEDERKRLNTLLAQTEDAANRLAALISRHSAEVREALDSVEKTATPKGLPDIALANGLAIIKMRAIVEAQAEGEVGKYALSVAEQVVKRVSLARDRLKG